MTKLVWNDIGEKLFETGIDRGVLYVDGEPGVPWNGLVSVSENPSGGDPRSTYIDGVKVLNYSTPEETALTLSAFYSPQEFDQCDGTMNVVGGMAIRNQPRKEFGLSYRTRIGNDVEGVEFGHKIHLIYNALAAPTSPTYSTLASSVDIQPLSWNITTRPIFVEGFAPSAHFEFDTTKMTENNIEYFERLLYGTDLTPPEMPTLDEVIEIFQHVYGTAEYGITTYP